MTGTVKFFIESKGFGFITNDETGQEIFVHISSLNGLEIKEGDKTREPDAAELRRVEPSPCQNNYNFGKL